MDILDKILNTRIESNVDAALLVRLVSCEIGLSYDKKLVTIHDIRKAMPKGYKFNKDIKVLSCRYSFTGLDIPSIDNKNRRALYALVMAWRISRADYLKKTFATPSKRYDGVI